MAPIGTQSSTPSLRKAPPIPFWTTARVRPALPDVGDVHVPDLPQGSLRDKFSDTDAVGVEAEFMVDHVHPSSRLCRREHPGCLTGIHGGGFLAENVRSRLDGRESLGLVEERRGRDANQVKFVGRQHCLPVIVHVRHLKLRGRTPSTLHPRGGQSHDLSSHDVAKRRQVRGLRETCSDDPHLHVLLLRCVPATAGPGSPGANLLGC